MSSGRKGKLNNSVIQYYGLITLLAGSVGGLVAMTYWLNNVWTGVAEFSWFTFFCITFCSFLLAVIGYILIRVGYEQ